MVFAPAVWFAAHKVPALGAAGAGVVGVALYRKSHAAAAAASSAGVPTTASSYASPQNAAAYNSSASDVYNAIQPQLEQTQQQLGVLGALIGRLTGGGTTTPAPPTTPYNPGTTTGQANPANVYDHYSQDLSTGKIYGISAHGIAYWLSGSDWAARLATGAKIGLQYRSTGSVAAAPTLNIRHAPATTPDTFRPRTAPAPAPAAAPARAYVVQRGDTLSSIAAKSNVTGGWNALYGANRGVVGPNANTIVPGQRLVLP